MADNQEQSETKRFAVSGTSDALSALNPSRGRGYIGPLPTKLCRSFGQRPVDLDSVPLSQRHQSLYIGRGRRLCDWRRLIQNKSLEPGWSAHHKHPDRPLADRLEPVRNIARPVHKSTGPSLQPAPPHTNATFPSRT
jgi:hypothetical protein